MHQTDDEIIDFDLEETADDPDFPYDPFEKEDKAEPEESSGEKQAENDAEEPSAPAEKPPAKTKAAKKGKRSSRAAAVLICFLALTTLCSIGLCIYMLSQPQYVPVNTNRISENTAEPSQQFQYSHEEVEALMAEAALAREQEIKQGIQEQLETPNPSVADMLRWLYTDTIIYLDSGGYHFIPILESIEKNNLQRTAFSLSENGVLTYTADDGITAKKGIDVSQHQGAIDWAQVAASGDVEFAIIRAGIRGYGSGALVTDSHFDANMQGAAANGIDTGVYFFTQAITVEEAQEEARYVLDLIAPYEIRCPIVIDVEDPASDARANALTKEERTAVVIAFCETVKAAGYTPMIYGNTYSLFAMLDIEQISQYPIWHAFYNTYVYYPYEIRMWQYTSTAYIPGIEGKVDLNLWFFE